MPNHSESPFGWELLLPDRSRTCLLQACLLKGDSAQQAWNAFIACAGDARRFFEADYRGLKSFLPFVEFALAANKVEADSAFRTYARVALLREELRCEIYYRVLDEVLTAVTSSGLSYRLIKGAALSPWLYPSALIRHNHAIDILVNLDDIQRVALVLQHIGLSVGVSSAARNELTLLHHSELPINVLTQLLDLPKFGCLGTFAGKSQTLRLRDRSVNTLDITSHLLQVLGNASCSAQHGNLRWVVDAFHLLKQAAQVDWLEFWRIARQLGIDGFCVVALKYLADALQIQVADRAVMTWQESSGATASQDQQRFFAALHCSRGSHIKVLKELRNNPALALTYLGFSIFTPADYLSFRYGVTTAALRIAWHAGRPARAIRYLLQRQFKA